MDTKRFTELQTEFSVWKLFLWIVCVFYRIYSFYFRIFAAWEWLEVKLKSGLKTLICKEFPGEMNQQWSELQKSLSILNQKHGISAYKIVKLKSECHDFEITKERINVTIHVARRTHLTWPENWPEWICVNWSWTHYLEGKCMNEWMRVNQCFVRWMTVLLLYSIFSISLCLCVCVGPGNLHWSIYI